MKRIVLLPQTDTVLICLPEKWTGIPIICHLSPMDCSSTEIDEIEIERIKNFYKNKRIKKSSRFNKSCNYS